MKSMGMYWQQIRRWRRSIDVKCLAMQSEGIEVNVGESGESMAPSHARRFVGLVLYEALRARGSAVYFFWDPIDACLRMVCWHPNDAGTVDWYEFLPAPAGAWAAVRATLMRWSHCYTTGDRGRFDVRYDGGILQADVEVEIEGVAIYFDAERPTLPARRTQSGPSRASV